MTAVAVISGIDINKLLFSSAKYLISWICCCPRNDQNSKKIKSMRIPRTGTCLKSLLVQVSNAVVSSDKYPGSKRVTAELRLAEDTKSDDRHLQDAPDRYFRYSVQG